jgi:hypothetical protein
MSTTFLIGAGASFHCLPVVSKIPERYSLFVERYREVMEAKYGSKYLLVNTDIDIDPDDSHADQYDLYKTLKYFETEIHNHLSIDTYAKKLYLSGEKEQLRYYKFCLSLFFTFEQVLVGPDSRYDAFFASVLGSRIDDFPEGLKILSWNYDFQFEIAYASYLGVPSIEQIGAGLPVVTASNVGRLENLASKFHIIKLNSSTEVWDTDKEGTEYFLNSRDYRLRRKFFIDDMKLTGLLFNSYKENRDSTTLSFAWEYQDSKGTQTVIDHAAFSTKDTKTLVVIGYSFPLVNRLIDKMIVDNMDRLEKIYIQDPLAAQLIEKVSHFCVHREDGRSVTLIPITDTSQFFLPYELR